MIVLIKINISHIVKATGGPDSTTNEVSVIMQFWITMIGTTNIWSTSAMVYHDINHVQSRGMLGQYSNS